MSIGGGFFFVRSAKIVGMANGLDMVILGGSDLQAQFRGIIK